MPNLARTEVLLGSGLGRLGLLAVALAVVSAGATATPAQDRDGDEAPADGPPSVVLITVEGLRRDALGCYGCERGTTPSIDAWAERAVVHTRAYATSSWANPSLASLMTSRYPGELGVVDLRSPLPLAAPTLAERLAPTHSTIGVVSNPFTTTRWGFDRGFEFFDHKYTVIALDRTTSKGLVDQALRFLGRCEPPYCLWLQLLDPYPSLLEHEGLARDRVPEYSGRIEPGTPLTELRRGARRLDAGDRAELERLYDAEVRMVDAQIGRFLTAAEESGWLDHALVVLTASHGVELLEHGSIGFGSHLAEELVRVPLVVQYPGAENVGRDDSVISLLDVVPTVLELCGVEPAAEVRGRSLASERTDEERFVRCETAKGRTMRAWIGTQFKLVENVARGAHLLFDLETDPGEQNDLAGSRPERLAELRRQLEASVAADAPPDSSSEPVELSEREIGFASHLGEELEGIVQGTGFEDLATGIEAFLTAWNAGNTEALSELFPAEGKRPEWKRFQATLEELGWWNDPPRVDTIVRGRRTPRSSVYEFRADGKFVEIRWLSRPGGWALTGIRIDGGDG